MLARRWTDSPGSHGRFIPGLKPFAAGAFFTTLKRGASTHCCPCYTGSAMFRAKLALLLAILLASLACYGSAYQASPKLVVILIIDQFRGDYLERYHSEFGPNGFRLFTDRGAYFPACYYQYANTRTAPGHATIATGAYSPAHGIFSNDWWDPAQKRTVTSVEDSATKLIGAEVEGVGSSPHNLLAGTLGDELRLATQGQSRVYGIALKDRSAILSTGYSANGAFWIDPDNGAWLTSTYYMSAPPRWLLAFNGQDSAKKYLNQEWKDTDGTLLASTKPHNFDDGKPVPYFQLVGSTPFGNDYEFDFARELIQQEKLGYGAVTDLLVISLSANDILGHMSGPDAPRCVPWRWRSTVRSVISSRFSDNNMVRDNSGWCSPLITESHPCTRRTSISICRPNRLRVPICARLNTDLSTRLRKQGIHSQRVVSHRVREQRSLPAKSERGRGRDPRRRSHEVVRLPRCVHQGADGQRRTSQLRWDTFT